MERYKRILITIVAIIGLITSLKLTAIFYESNYNEYALNSFCSINDFIDCDGVARTQYAVMFGIPLAVWGLILYSFILFMTYVDKLKKYKLFGFLEVFKNPVSYIFAIGLFAFLGSMTLACISVFAIKKICILCFFTYILNLLIALIALVKAKRPDDMIMDCFRDFWAAVKVKKYLIAFSVVLLIIAGILVYTSRSFVLAPHMKQVSEFEKLRRMKHNPYKVKGNILGDKDGKITVYVYTDYQCPGCSVYNITIHRAAKNLKNVKFVHKNFPLDKNCNRLMNDQMHDGSCMLAKYNIAAGNQDKYWEMNDLLFEEKDKTEENILKKAQEMGFDVEKLKADVNSKETNDKLKEEIEFALDNNLSVTPSVQVGMKVTPGALRYSDLEKLLLEAGAEKK